MPKTKLAVNMRRKAKNVLQKWLFLTVLIIPGIGYAAPEKTLNLVASLRPLSLIALDVVRLAGLDDAIEVSTLLQPGSSPHHWSLSVNQLALLRQADLFIWIGEDLEPYLPKVVEAQGMVNIALASLPSLSWPPELHQNHGHGQRDPHIWLDPINGLAIARAIADSLAKQVPAWSDALNSAVEQYRVQLIDQKKEFDNRYQLFTDHSVAVYHDSLGHFLQRYRLKQAVALTAVPDQQLGMRTLLRLKKHSPACLLADIDELNQARGYSEKLQWPLVELDLLARHLVTDGYVVYQRSIAEAVEACLKGAKQKR